MRKRIGRLVDAIRRSLKRRKYHIDFIKKTKSFTPLMIFQMGKVGSASIYHSAKKTYGGDTIHLHTFNNKDKDWDIKAFYNYSVRDKKPIKIISLTREPIGRNVSAFFQNIETITQRAYSGTEYTVEELKKQFLENSRMNHDEPLTWFDDSLLKHFNINIYESPFPYSGWQIIKKNNVDLLLMKSEIDNTLKESLIKDFLGSNTFKLSPYNIGTEKNYGNDYKKFKAQVKLPSYYLDKLVNSKYAKHFYSTEELQAARKVWE